MSQTYMFILAPGQNDNDGGLVTDDGDVFFELKLHPPQTVTVNIDWNFNWPIAFYNATMLVWVAPNIDSRIERMSVWEIKIQTSRRNM